MPKSPKSPATLLPVPVELVERRIYLIRSHKVMLNSDLAELRDRFPEDFMFQLTAEEFENLRFQFETSRWGGRRYPPYAFTEQGVAMLSSVLSSKRAVQVNIAIMRAFVRLREYLATHKELAHQMEAVQRTQKEHTAHINAIWTAIQKLIEPPATPRRRIGFRDPDEK